MSFEFLAPGAAVADGTFAPLARSPMERDARAAGARFEDRDGWRIAAGYSTPDRELRACRDAVGWADASHLGKLELQAAAGELAAIADVEALALGHATRAAGAWWCRLTPGRVLVICDPGALPALREQLRDRAAAAARPAGVVEVTTTFAALTLAGPLAREALARFTAIDVRPQVTPVHGVRPGSLARCPGLVVREAEDRFLLLFGWALGHYMWTVVADAARHLGGSPIGIDTLEAVEPGVEAAAAKGREHA